MKLSNTQKFKQHKSFIERLENGRIYDLGLSVQDIEDMKYSDDKKIRKAAAIIKHTQNLEDELEMNNINKLIRHDK